MKSLYQHTTDIEKMYLIQYGLLFYNSNSHVEKMCIIRDLLKNEGIIYMDDFKILQIQIQQFVYSKQHNFQFVTQLYVKPLFTKKKKKLTLGCL